MAIAILPAASERHLQSRHSPAPTPDVDFRRIYGAFVTPYPGHPERTVFINAVTDRGAHERMAQAIAALDRCSQQEAAERTYNVTSATELVECGVSAEPLWRLLECGRSGDRVAAWITHPLFLLEDSAPLILAWARVSAVTP